MRRTAVRVLRTLCVMLALTAALLCTAACSKRDVINEYGTIEIAPGRPIIIGVSVALTGDDSGDGRAIEQGVRLAVDEVNRTTGRPIEVMVLDDGCSAEGSIAAARRFTAAAGVVGVIGPMCSRGCVPASLVYDEAKMVMITPACTASVLTGQGFETVFRVAWSDELAAAAGARFAAEALKAKRVYAVNDQTFYGKTQRDAFKVSLEERGGRLVADEKIDAGEWDFTGLVADIKAARPDLIYFGGFLPAGRFLIQQLRYAGVSAPFMAGDALADTRRFIAESNTAADGAYITDVRPAQGPSYAGFARRYRERWGDTPGGLSAYGYDAAQTLLRAVEKAAADKGGTLHIDQEKLRDAVADTDFNGASGRVQFLHTGERRVAGVAVILRARGEGFEVVKEYPPE
jgi:branched-chain amino acid transport system substrate-binding protein